jgi:Caspase domain
MATSRACLFGVHTYRDERIPALDSVKRDLDDLAKAFQDRKFDVHVTGRDEEPVTRTALMCGIREACRSAKGMETLVIYFGGHGIHYAGRDFLIPHDVTLDFPELLPEFLVSMDIADVVDNSPSRNVIFMIDACREGVNLGETRSLSLVSWGKGAIAAATKRQFVPMYACGPGEFARGAGGRGLFTTAICSALQSAPAECSFRDFKDSAQDHLDRLADIHNKGRQTIHVRVEEKGHDPLRFVFLGDSDGEPFNQRCLWPGFPRPCQAREDSKPTPESGTPPNERPPKPGPITNEDDPQKGRWGGKTSSKGRRVRVDNIESVGKDEYEFDVIVEAIQGELKGPVVFHLHDTYPRSVIKIRKIEDKKRATLRQIYAYGASTIGVQVTGKDGKWTELELDTSNVSEFSKKFRSD